jgi:predicted nucleic acid-binding protein
VTRVADTSFLLMLFDHSDPRQGKAATWASDPEPIAVPAEVLGETLGVLHRRLGFAKADGVWRQLTTLPHVEFQETGDVEATAEVFARHKGKLSWVDAAVVAACTRLGAKPLAFDDDLVRAAAR